MRINQSKRIYMNEEDGSPGGGSVPPAPVESAAPTPTPAPAVVTIDQVKGLMTEMLGGFKNAMFADMRKAGALGKEKSDPTPTASAPAVSAAAPASTGLTEAQLEARLEQERVLTRTQLEYKLTDAQVKRLKGALKADQPEDVGSWTNAYLADIGIARPTDTAQPTASIPQASGQPISDKGSPAPGSAVFWEREFAENPVGMSTAARQAMDAKHGVDVARRMRVEAANAQLQRIKATPK